MDPSGCCLDGYKKARVQKSRKCQLRKGTREVKKGWKKKREETEKRVLGGNKKISERYIRPPLPPNVFFVFICSPVRRFFTLNSVSFQSHLAWATTKTRKPLSLHAPYCTQQPRMQNASRTKATTTGVHRPTLLLSSSRFQQLAPSLLPPSPLRSQEILTSILSTFTITPTRQTLHNLACVETSRGPVALAVHRQLMSQPNVKTLLADHGHHVIYLDL